MRVYVASRWSDTGRYLARFAMRMLRDRGHVIAHDWTTEDEVCADYEEAARKDLDGVYTSDALIIIPMDGGTGEWVEFGVALARLMPIIVVRHSTEKQCIFEHLPGVIHVSTISDAVSVFERMKR